MAADDAAKGATRSRLRRPTRSINDLSLANLMIPFPPTQTLEIRSRRITKALLPAHFSEETHKQVSRSNHEGDPFNIAPQIVLLKTVCGPG